MAEQLTVGTWNALNSFGDQRVGDALEVVKKIDADVLYLPEFSSVGDEFNEHYFSGLEQLNVLGYSAWRYGNFSRYPTSHGRDVHTMAMFSRVGDQQPLPIPAGERYTMHFTAPNGLSIRGVHFSDHSEAHRLFSAIEVIRQIDDSPAVVMGDFNAMHRRGVKARALRMLSPITSLLEVEDYYDTSKKLQRTIGIAERLVGMANSDTMAVFNNFGFRDADPDNQPTFGKKRAVFKIDHIIATSEVGIEDYRVHEKTDSSGEPLSDHNPISAKVLV